MEPHLIFFVWFERVHKISHSFRIQKGKLHKHVRRQEESFPNGHQVRAEDHVRCLYFVECDSSNRKGCLHARQLAPCRFFCSSFFLGLEGRRGGEQYFFLLELLPGAWGGTLLRNRSLYMSTRRRLTVPWARRQLCTVGARLHPTRLMHPKHARLVLFFFFFSCRAALFGFFFYFLDADLPTTPER